MKPRISIFISIGCCFALTVLASAVPLATASAQASINRNLKVGDSGSDVLLLQKTLNLSAWTRISASGPGSPGNETMFFGLKTKEAVARFQERYSSEVLAPAGLTRGTGFVGALTRAKLAALISPTAAPQIAHTPAQSLQPLNSVAASTSSNPNLINLEPFVEEVAKVQEDNNVESPLIAKTKEQIRIEARTKGDFRAEVLKKDTEAINARRQAEISNDSWRDILIASFKSVNPFVKVANAQGPAFGGPILYFFPCTCSESTLVYVGPPSPVYLMEYVYGTQAFLSYNLPYARFVKGLYEPGSGATCSMYIGTGCTIIPTGGLISTVVGSSA